MSPGFSWILLLPSGELARRLAAGCGQIVVLKQRLNKMVAIQSVYSIKMTKMRERCSTQDIRIWCKIVRCEGLCLYTNQGVVDGSEKGVSCLTG